MVLAGIRKLGPTGFTLVELTVAVAAIAILAVVSVPFFNAYYQATKLRAAADAMVSILNGARYQAIKHNTTICVAVSGHRLQYHVGGCGGAVWLGTETDGAGFVTLPTTVELTGATANVVFTNLGAASVGGTYTIRNPADGRSLTVTVAGSGRITIP